MDDAKSGKWVRLTDADDDTEVWVNIANAMSMRWFDGEGYAQISFAGGEDDAVAVKEKPKEILGRDRI
jgi:hypothetical protein